MDDTEEDGEEEEEATLPIGLEEGDFAKWKPLCIWLKKELRRRRRRRWRGGIRSVDHGFLATFCRTY